MRCVQLVFSLSSIRMKILSCARNLRSIWILFHPNPHAESQWVSFHLCSSFCDHPALPHSMYWWLRHLKSAFIFHSELQRRWTNPRSLTSLHSQITIRLRNSSYACMCARTRTQAPAGHSGGIVIRIECFSWRSDIITNWSSFEFWQGNYMLLYGVAIATGPFSMQGDVECGCCWKLGGNWGCWGGKGGLVAQDVCEEKWGGGCGLGVDWQLKHNPTNMQSNGVEL